MKTFIRISALIALLLFAWYIAMDRVTPYTSNARVRAIVIPIVPQVSGYVSAVAVPNARLVEPGSVLAEIDPRPYQLAVAQAQAQLETATQNVGATSAEVELAQANVARAEIDLESTRLQTSRVFELEKKGLVAVARADDARAKLADVESKLEAANADLVRAKERLGVDDESNPQIRNAVALLRRAELDLEWATLRAPSRGAVIDLSISEGSYARTGQPIMTFVSSDDIWIDAYVTENNLGRISIGDPVEVSLDIHPGRIFTGTVASFAGGASFSSRQDASGSGGLPLAPRSSGWMRDPQRFPLRIRLTGYEVGNAEDDALFQVNGQAEVIVYTGEPGLLHTLGRLWIRLNSWVSYVY